MFPFGFDVEYDIRGAAKVRLTGLVGFDRDRIYVVFPMEPSGDRVNTKNRKGTKRPTGDEKGNDRRPEYRDVAEERKRRNMVDREES